MGGSSWVALLCFLSIGCITLGRNIDDQSPGLYDASDDVLIINNDTFRERIFSQDHATLLEFYNSFCGHCRRYAPFWKSFASDVIAWQRVVQIAAVDCSADENNELCRKYEVMAYPSLRYFPPNFNDTNTYGSPMESEHNEANLRSSLVEMLRNESRPPLHWPHFPEITETTKNNLFVGLSEHVHFIFLIFATANGTLANEIALDFVSSPNIVIRWIGSSTIAHSYGMSNVNSLSVINRKFEVYPMSIHLQERKEIQPVILRFLKEHNMSLPITRKPNRIVPNANPGPNISSETSDHVYLNDLEQAVWFSLHQEITQVGAITGDRLDALKRYINILKRYLPVGLGGQQFLNELDAFIAASIELSGNVFAVQYAQLMSKWEPLNVTKTWIGCQGSTPNVRGYTCGLWELFHFLTVQSASDTYSSDSLDSLMAIHGYVKYFFGCTECSQHFQTMAEEMHIWSVSSKDDAVMWLWKAHNKVNARLAGDITEDPAHPKIQFPNEKICPGCRDLAQNKGNEINWNVESVLQFLKVYYSTSNLNRAKTRRSVVIIPRAEKRIMDIGFSDLDMRIGILLYVFCIGMVVLAIKMFVRRGYRKKFYTYDYKDSV